jgi:hypothetical protein
MLLFKLILDWSFMGFYKVFFLSALLLGFFFSKNTVTPMNMKMEIEGVPMGADADLDGLNKMFADSSIYKEQKKPEDPVKCAICLEDESPEQALDPLPCGHRFHKSCIAGWFKQKTNCPVCRREHKVEVGNIHSQNMGFGPQLQPQSQHQFSQFAPQQTSFFDQHFNPSVQQQQYFDDDNDDFFNESPQRNLNFGPNQPLQSNQAFNPFTLQQPYDDDDFFSEPPHQWNQSSNPFAPRLLQPPNDVDNFFRPSQRSSNFGPNQFPQFNQSSNPFAPTSNPFAPRLLQPPNDVDNFFNRPSQHSSNFRSNRFSQ